MAKKSVRKKAPKSAKKKNSFIKFFSFPVLAIFAFVALAVITVFLVGKPDKNVLGVTATDYMFVNDSEQSAIIKQAQAAGQEWPTFHYIRVFRDANRNGKKELTENCLSKQVTIKVNSKVRSISACDNIKIYTKNRYATITLSEISGYSFTGLTYMDNTNYPNSTTRLNGAHSQFVKGKAEGYPQSYYFTQVDFGVRKK